MNYNPAQSGTVLVFKQGTNPIEIEEKLKELRDILEYVPTVHTFNPEWGGPVWYIP